MKFIQSSAINAVVNHKHVLMPYFDETDLMGQLKKINEHLSVNRITLAIEDLEHMIKDGLKDKIVVPTNSGSMTLRFMALGSKKVVEPKKVVDLFKSFGKIIEEDWTIFLDGLDCEPYSEVYMTEMIIQGMYIGAYSFLKENLVSHAGQRVFNCREKFVNEKKHLTIILVSSSDVHRSIDKGMTYGRCINIARMLGDMPANYLHVKEFGEYLEDFAEKYQLKCDVLGNEALEELNSGGILGVNAGSEKDARLIAIYYEGDKDAVTTGLVGKGVMFDSGGYHVKSIAGMEGMKYDMCGAANLVAALEIAILERSKENILLVLPIVENLISPNACKMGDVLLTMSGKTVEVYNTDAEGRLILCDAITYAQRQGVDRMIDLATLTYSCQGVLGDEISGIFANDEDFYQLFLEKIKGKNEKVWRLPLDPILSAPLYKTQTADLINYAPGYHGGASVAAGFLEMFINEDLPWIHLDFSGPAVNRTANDKQSAGATGTLAASIAAFLT